MENTVESNKLIAEFMGALTVDQYGNVKEDINTFKYHISWDWLMPVVEKIGETETDYEPLSNVSLYSSLPEVYSAVVEFITNKI